MLLLFLCVDDGDDDDDDDDGDDDDVVLMFSFSLNTFSNRNGQQQYASCVLHEGD